MRRTKALTTCLIIPCLLYAVTFVIMVARSSTVVEASMLRQLHTVFAAIIAVALLVEGDELSAER